MSFASFWPGILGGAGAGFVVQFSQAGYTVSDFGIPPGDARSTIELRADGTVRNTRLNGSNQTIGTWVTGAGFDANDYDFQWRTNGSNPNWGPSDPINTWINGGGTLVWGEEETGIGNNQAVGILDIRPAGGGSTIDSADCTLYAESTP